MPPRRPCQIPPFHQVCWLLVRTRYLVYRMGRVVLLGCTAFAQRRSKLTERDILVHSVSQVVRIGPIHVLLQFFDLVPRVLPFGFLTRAKPHWVRIPDSPISVKK